MKSYLPLKARTNRSISSPPIQFLGAQAVQDQGKQRKNVHDIPTQLEQTPHPRHSLSRISIFPPGSDNVLVPAVNQPHPLGKRSSNLPGRLKARLESLSGLSMDDVQVHYNSPRAARLQALAYTQGNEIHVGPGQEKHLAHEAWHVVQQKQGRVQPTLQVEGVAVNDNQGLEDEANAMGTRAMAGTTLETRKPFTQSTVQASSPQALAPVQRVITRSQAKKKKKKAPAKKGKDIAKGYKASKDKAAARLKRAAARAKARIARNGEIKTGRFKTVTGPITISPGLGGKQRMTQANKKDYGDETYGSYPAYEDVQKGLPEEALPVLLDPNEDLPDAMTDKQKLAISLATGLTYISEPHRAPGYDKPERAFIRQRIEEGTGASHPFDPSLNVAVSTAQEARDFMSGDTKLTKAQEKAVDDYMSSSSDEGDDEYAFRKGILEEIDE